MIAKAQAIECWKCNPTVRSATESHWRIYPVKHVGRNSWLVCADCAKWSKDEDDHDIGSWPGSFTVLYLPIVRPDVGSEQAIAMEVAMHVVCRLLRTQADITAAERDEAEETLALLRATQAEAERRASASTDPRRGDRVLTVTEQTKEAAVHRKTVMTRTIVEMLTLSEVLPFEIARVRDVVIPAYLECGIGGVPAVALMRADLGRASKAMIEGDIVAMISVCESLKGWEL